MELKTQLYVGQTHPLEKVKEPLTTHIQCKANGGLYTSTYLGQSLGSEWLQWCLANEFHLPESETWNGWLLKINPKAKIYVVDTVEDMHFLYDTFGYNLIEGTKLEWIDFNLMAKHYDGLHLTSRGQAVTRHPNFFELRASDMDKNMRNFYGWDVESTHLFRNVFEVVKKVKLRIKQNEYDY